MPNLMWDVAAGLMIAFAIVAGIIYGARNRERGVMFTCLAFMAAIVIWRVNAWYETTGSYAHKQALAQERAAEFAKYDIAPTDHQ